MKTLLAEDIAKVSARVTDIDIEDHLRAENRFFRHLREEWSLDEFHKHGKQWAEVSQCSDGVPSR